MKTAGYAGNEPVRDLTEFTTYKKYNCREEQETAKTATGFAVGSQITLHLLQLA